MEFYTDDILNPIFRSEFDDKTYMRIRSCMNRAPKVEAITKNDIRDYMKGHDPVCRNNLQHLLDEYD